MTASELIRWLQREDPDLPVLILIGDDPGGVGNEGLALDIERVIFAHTGRKKTDPGSTNAYVMIPTKIRST
jgi:hypothetical protein